MVYDGITVNLRGLCYEKKHLVSSSHIIMALVIAFSFAGCSLSQDDDDEYMDKTSPKADTRKAPTTPNKKRESNKGDYNNLDSGVKSKSTS